jgi:phosphate-selective porin OprO/OprP
LGHATAISAAGIASKKDFDPSTFSGGLWEVSAGYSKFDASDITATSVGYRLATGSQTTIADTWRVGVKFIPEANTRILLNFAKTDFDTAVSVSGVSSNAFGTVNPVKSEKAINMRVQYDF